MKATFQMVVGLEFCDRADLRLNVIQPHLGLFGWKNGDMAAELPPRRWTFYLALI
jgi:hypothetical protein